MKLYDSSLRAKVDFVPLVPGKVSMYVCGPTVYDNIHIGNARTFLSFDVIRRWLEERGFEVAFAQNLTDVDDKIIKRANERGVEAQEVAATYAKAFVDVTGRFGVKEPTVRPRATEEVPEMVAMISALVEKGYAYEAGGDVYFAVRSDPGYGCVSGRKVDELLAGARIEAGEAKRDPLDFALWKAAKPGEPTWDSPWGPGRPGWHTECAAMVHRYLGMPVDIHGGGSDLQFPHHENECAQARCCWGETFANHWMHTGMLLVDGEKMSKSLGNFFTLKQVLDEHPADALRLLMLQTHYRTPLDFSFERLKGAEGSLERIRNTVANLDWAAGRSAAGAPSAGGAPCPLADDARKARLDFETCMDDDFNTAGALAAVFDLVSASNVYLDAAGSSVDATSCEAASETISWGLGVLGIDAAKPSEDGALPYALVELARSKGCFDGDDPSLAAEALVALRAKARAAKDWGVADAIRDELASLGLAIEDTAQGARVRRV